MRTVNFETDDFRGRFALCHRAVQVSTMPNAARIRQQLERIGVAGETLYHSPAGGSVMLDEANYETLKASVGALKLAVDDTLAWLEQLQRWQLEQEA
jgi:hypothetical protein